MKPHRFLATHWPALVAAACVLLMLAEGLLPGRVFMYRDLGTQFWPVVGEARSGHGVHDLLPFWTHASANGRPLIPNPGFSFLSPFALLWLVLPHAAAFDAFLVAHALLGAVGMTRLARRLGLSPSAALCAGVGLGLGGGVVSAMNLWWALVALGWAPWVLLASIRACEERSPRALALFALALALQADGGMPEVVLCTLLVGVAITLARAESWRRAALGVLTWGGCGLLGIALCAPQLVPALLHARRTYRGIGFDASQVLYDSLDPRALPGLVLPRWGGHPVHRLVPGSFPGAAWTDTGTPYLLSHDCGLVVGVLAILAVSSALRGRMDRGRRALVAALVGVATLGVIVALGRHVAPVRWIVEAVAPLPLRYTVKALFATFLAVPLLAGLGLDALIRAMRDTRAARALGLALALTAGLDLLLAHGGFTPAMDERALAEPPLAQQVKFLARDAGIADGSWRLHHERSPTGAWGPPPGSIAPTEQAMLSWQHAMLMPPMGMEHGILHSYDRQADLLDDVHSLEGARRAYAGTRQEWARALGDAGVLFVVSPHGDLEAQTGHELVLEGEIGADLGLPAGSGWLYRDLAFRPRFEPEGPKGDAAIVSIEDDHHGMAIGVRAVHEERVIVREALGDPSAWTATASGGTPLVIERAGDWWAVRAPAGETTIRFDYVPRGWDASVAVSAVAGLLVALAMLSAGRRASAPDADPDAVADRNDDAVH